MENHLYQQALKHHQKREYQEAEELCRQLLSTQSEHSDALHLLGVIAQSQNRLESAIQLIQQAIAINPQPHYYNNLANFHLQNQQFPQALEAYQSAIQLKPDFVDAYANSGALYLMQKQWDLAIQQLKTAIQLNPQFVKGYINLGVAYHKQGLLEQAENYYQQALKIKPNMQNVLNNIKQLQIEKLFFKHLEQGKKALQDNQLSQAESSLNQAKQIIPQAMEPYHQLAQLYRQQENHSKTLSTYQEALQYQPQNPFILEGLGATYQALKQYELAIQSYQQALNYHPQLDNSHYGLAFIYFESEQIHFAIQASLNCIELQPTNIQYIQLLFNCFFHPQLPSNIISLLKPQEQQLKKVFNHCFTLNTINKQSLYAPVLNFLGSQPDFSLILQGATPEVLKHKLQNLQPFFEPLFLCIINQCVNQNIHMENFLTVLRRYILEEYSRTSSYQENLFQLACALANQSFNNEYVFSVHADEVEILRSIEDKLNTSVPGVELQMPLAIFAMYHPLNTLKNKLKELANPSLQWQKIFQKIIQYQVVDYLIEDEIKSDILSLTAIEQSTSKKVQEQYEENPYPRWLTINQPSPQNMYDYLVEKFPYYSFAQSVKQPLNILVAGCGTGQQPLSTALLFNNINIMAVDLSTSSLAYAIRKTRELGIDHIQYKQADILELESIEERFDIIECQGVLHHLKDPLQGWRILCKLLKPQGLMKIGLYSKLARRDIIKAQNILKQEQLSLTADGIRKGRNILLNSPDEEIQSLTNFPDFYNLSMFRDLVLHVQEYNYDLKEIQTILKQLNLNFIGFHFSEKHDTVIHSFNQEFSNSAELNSLESWHQYELKHPNTFIGMYNFWCQKK